MGNRAVITTEVKDLGVYLHWNGGRNSIEGFLLYCKLKGYRCPEDDCYGWARLCQVIGNFFRDGLSVGIDRYNRLDTDNGDNGTYIIKDWQIVGKEFKPLDKLDIGQVKSMLEAINNSMPTSEQLDIDDLYKAADELQAAQPITPKQIKAIHAVIRDLDVSLTDYHHILKTLYRVSTCKDLTEEQASSLIEYLNKVKGINR